MKLGLQVPNFTWPASPVPFAQRFADIARRAEDAGCSSFWVMDHFFQIQMVGPAENDMLEGYSALSFVAGITSKINLGTMVTGVTYRHPGLLIKTVTTLDVLSQGRAYLGIGAAWNEQEHLGLGVPFPPLKERFERLEETLQLAQQMFAGNDQPFQGEHYQLQRPLNSPPPVRRPPILIGGSGEKKTLRMVAQYGDACNLFEFQPAEIARKLDV
ncbi:MAG: LLM class F420-dependent oxidoreductase, partial [Nakamurella sp.]